MISPTSQVTGFFPAFNQLEFPSNTSPIKGSKNQKKQEVEIQEKVNVFQLKVIETTSAVVSLTTWSMRRELIGNDPSIYEKWDWSDCSKSISPRIEKLLNVFIDFMGSEPHPTLKSEFEKICDKVEKLIIQLKQYSTESRLNLAKTIIDDSFKERLYGVDLLTAEKYENTDDLELKIKNLEKDFEKRMQQENTKGDSSKDRDEMFAHVGPRKLLKDHNFEKREAKHKLLLAELNDSRKKSEKVFHERLKDLLSLFEQEIAFYNAALDSSTEETKMKEKQKWSKFDDKLDAGSACILSSLETLSIKMGKQVSAEDHKYDDRRKIIQRNDIVLFEDSNIGRVLGIKEKQITIRGQDNKIYHRAANVRPLPSRSKF